ncbi:PH domain-containing protein [Kineococcus sp. SYSU DK004]|uniref:PH domain-containing protein n=1 Tax=Kineococcus sp. SYSU DK004 TaxID=3383125 RepID=UPI003D7D5B4B
MTAPLDAPFRPRRARIAGYAVAVLVVVTMVVISLALGTSPDSGWTVVDTLSALVFAALVAGGLVRLVGVRALPTDEALVVRNVLYTTRVDWGAVIAVRFGGADPWLTLDLDDGQNLAVMAVQRADGAHAQAEAERLARLVRSRAPQPPPG